MTPPKIEAGFVRMPEDEFEPMLARAAEQGARRALADVGLDGPEAAIDIHDLRTLNRSLFAGGSKVSMDGAYGKK